MRTKLLILLSSVWLVASIPAVLAAPLGTPSLGAGQDILQESGEITVNGGSVSVVRYTWRDSAGDPRSVSLVPASGTNSGYAAQMSYQVNDAGMRTVYINADPGGDGGFGYFVSHELVRNFAGGGSGTIAALHGEDDSPFGRYLPSTGTAQSVGQSQAAHEFRLDYPRWGTVALVPDPSSGTISATPADHQRFLLPVVIRWHFVAGRDYPVWSVDYDLSAASDHISTDVRGPYGVMVFNESVGPNVTTLKWGEAYHFAASAAPGTDIGAAAVPPGGIDWTWNVLNAGRRYNVLASDAYEFGIVSTAPYVSWLYGDQYSNHRGSTKAIMGGCGYGMLSLPCDWEWPYQSFQYNYDPAARPKIAWGSSPYLGSSLASVWINDSWEAPISGKGHIHYGAHIVFGRSTAGAPLALASAAAAAEPNATLTVASSPAQGGSVSYTVLGDAGGSYTDASKILAPWASVRLTAAPAAGYAFSAWGGACAGEASANCMIAMDAARSVTANFTALYTADLSVTQSPLPVPAGVGKDVAYVLVAANGGPDAASAVTLTDTLPAGSTLVWVTPGCANASGVVTCSLGTFPAGASARVMVVVRPTAAGSIMNNVAVSAATADSNSANNASSLSITVPVTPAGTPVLRYRLYSPVTLEHHFTTDLNEYTVLGGYVGTWIQEGTVGKVLDNPGSFNGVAAVPYYRLYDTSTRWHHWTTDVNEYYTLIQFPWWNGEGTDGFILPSTTAGATQLYRLLYPFIPGLHHWTIDPTEYGILISTYGWIGEGGAGFVVQ